MPGASVLTVAADKSDEGLDLGSVGVAEAVRERGIRIDWTVSQ